MKFKTILDYEGKACVAFLLWNGTNLAKHEKRMLK